MTVRPRAVVTGGAGFIGSHLCERLLAEGYGVICIDNLITGSWDNVAHLADHGRFAFVRADVTDPIEISGRVDAVLHFASPASPLHYLRWPIETLKTGSIGTLNSLALAREKNARFLLASTSESYGEPSVHPQPETYWGHVNPVGPRSVYDEAKRFAEATSAAHRRSCGVDTAIIRIFNTYGPRMQFDDGRAVPTFVRQALRNEPITVAGRGDQTRSLQYIDDLIEGCVRVLQSRECGPINLGNPEEITIASLASLIRDLVGSSSEITNIPRPEDDPSLRCPDISAAQDRLGWKPVVTLVEGLKTTIEWFRQRHDAQT